jgi:hypothetical protein
MKVTLNHEEVTQACQEWVERHYGIKAKGTPEMVATVKETGNDRVFTVKRVALTFPEAPKPEGSPYRTPA